MNVNNVVTFPHIQGAAAAANVTNNINLNNNNSISSAQPPPPSDGLMTPPQQIKRRHHQQMAAAAPLRYLDALLEELDENDFAMETPPTEERVISLSPLSIRTQSSASSQHRATPDRPTSSSETVVEGIRRGYRRTLWMDDGRRLRNRFRNINNTLPNHLMLHVFSYLAVSDLAMAAPTCRVWFVRMDPWVYLEHHGWIPLAPLSRCESVHIRPSCGDTQHLTSVLASCTSCVDMSLELNGHNALLTAIASNPIHNTELMATFSSLTALRTMHVHRPTTEDLVLLGKVMATIPALDFIELSDVSLPMGVRILTNSITNTTASTIRLHKAGHLLGPSLWRLFKVNPRLSSVVLNKCILGSGSGNKIKVSCTLLRDGTVVRPILHSTKGKSNEQHQHQQQHFIDRSSSSGTMLCVACVFQSCPQHALRPVAPPPHYQQQQQQQQHLHHHLFSHVGGGTFPHSHHHHQQQQQQQNNNVGVHNNNSASALWHHIGHQHQPLFNQHQQHVAIW
eukprot:PhM_4_TR471/c1_g3_i1/m.27514